MFFNILLTFGDLTQDLEVLFERSLKSILTQTNTNWKITVVGNLNQISAIKNSLDNLKKHQNIINQIVFIEVKTYGDINLNQVFNSLDTGFEGQNVHKLLILEIGDYLSPDFLKIAQDFLHSLSLNQENLQSYLPFCDFKYLNSSDQVFDSNFVLKTKLSEATASDFIFRPKLLLRPIQLFWDLSLIKKFGIKFDSELQDIDLKMAKFSLDYILTITKANNFLLPTPKLCPEIFYITSNQIVESFHASKSNIWSQILADKQETLQSIGGLIWWKYRWLKFWHR